MKSGILAATKDLPSFFVVWFSRFLFRHTNPKVLVEMKKYENLPVQIVLNTAAPRIYVEKYADFFNFSHVFSTHCVQAGKWVENLGKEKLQALKQYYGEDVVIECIITDHYNDLPLLEVARKRILVSPSRLTLKAVKSRFEYDII